MSEEGSEGGGPAGEANGHSAMNALLTQVSTTGPLPLLFSWRARRLTTAQLKSTVYAVREEALHQLDAVGKACEEYSGANFLQYAPAPRATKAQPHPAKPPFSNMQIYFLARNAEETEARRAGGDATATAERWVVLLAKAVEGSRRRKYAWVEQGVDLTPHGHTAHSLKQALGPIADSFVYSGKLRRREKKEDEGGERPAASSNAGEPRKRGRPKKNPAPEAAAAPAAPEAAPGPKKRTKKTN
jgi:hypothetical protein